MWGRAMMRRRDFLTASAATAAMPFTLPWPAAAQSKPSQIIIMTWGGAWGDLLHRHIDPPFEKETGVKVVQETGASPVERITKLKVSLSSQTYDVLNLNDALMEIAVRQGVLEPVNRSSPHYTNLKDVYPKLIHDQWVAAIFSSL